MVKATKQQDVPDPTSNLAESALNRYARQLRHFFGRRMQSCDVDDLAQEVYLRLLSTDPKQVRKALPFILGVASHVLSDHLRAETKEQEHFPSAGEALDVLREQASDALGDRLDDYLSVHQEIDEVLKQLSPVHAAALILHKRDGLSYEEIAQRLNRSVHTVHIYLRAARAQIRMAHWSDEDGESYE
jgi:RNA polymerase sigma factor (sigma-70 family)